MSNKGRGRGKGFHCPECNEITYPVYYHLGRGKGYTPTNRRYCLKCDKFFKIELKEETT